MDTPQGYGEPTLLAWIPLSTVFNSCFMEDLQGIQTNTLYCHVQCQQWELLPFRVLREKLAPFGAMLLTFSPLCGCEVVAPGCAGGDGGTVPQMTWTAGCTPAAGSSQGALPLSAWAAPASHAVRCKSTVVTNFWINASNLLQLFLLYVSYLSA